jgi:hypothetical protein
VTVPQTQPDHFGWLVDDFVNRVSGVAHVLVVSQLTPQKRTELHGALGR